MPRRRTASEVLDHIASKSEWVGDCLVWQGGTGRQGYGQNDFDGRTWKTHRLVYTLHHGAVADDLCVCHTCDNPPCVNPEHLWVGTQADNVHDRDAKGRTWHPPLKTMPCPQGHPMEFTYRDGKRVCLACKRERDRRYYEENREARNAKTRQYHDEHREEQNAKSRERYATDPEYRERTLAKGRYRDRKRAERRVAS